MATINLLTSSRPGYRLCTRLLVLFIIFFASVRVSAQFHQVHIEPDVDNVVKMSFYKPNEGFVAFNKYIGYTVDSGRTFVQKTITNSNVDYSGLPVDLTFGFNINGVHAIDQNNILVYGDYSLAATILSSSDGGNTFKIIFYAIPDLNSGPAPSLTDMVFPQNDAAGYAVYDHHIIKTTDGGLSWSQNYTAGSSQLLSLQFIDDNNGIAFGPGGELVQLTGAGAWHVLNKPPGTMNCASFVSPTAGWVSNIDGTIYMTQDDGATWTQQNPQAGTLFFASKMQFINDSTGYAIATHSYDVFKTSNSGRIWEALPRSSNYHYLGYTLLDFQMMNNYTWAGGGHGYIALSGNNGGPLTVPLADFAVDTIGLSNTGNVTLLNYSRPGYQYQWVVNGKAVGNTYNTSYTHNIFHIADTISLVVSNARYKDTLTQYAYFHLVPFVKSFAPASAVEGDTVTIQGFNFVGVTSVSFGGIAAASFTVVSSTTITAVVGPGASGNVEVIGPYGAYIKSGFTFIPGPSITSVSPLTALAGTTVTITGANFINVKQVLFGGVPATSFAVVSPTQMTAVVGTGNSGNITVTTKGGTTSFPGFEMIPVITSFSPSSGTIGTVIYIRGTGLNHVSSVTVGGVAAGSIITDSLGTVSAVVGAGASGNIVITAPGGTVTSTSLFTYYNRPIITSFSPLTGPAGTTVTITGTNFSASATQNNVFFGAVKANVVSASSTSLTVTAPLGLTYVPIIVETNNLVAYSELPFTLSFANTTFNGRSFSKSITLSPNAGAHPFVVDIDGDGKPDVFTRNAAINGFSVLLNNGQPGKFTYTQQDLGNMSSIVFSLADIDGDGLPDLLVVSPNTSNTGLPQVMVYRNISTPGHVAFGHPLAMPSLYATISNIQISAYDMDGDGKPDIVVTSGDQGTGIALYRNTSYPGQLSFYAGTDIEVGPRNNILIADFNGDGLPDILLPSDGYGEADVLKNQSSPGTFSFWPAFGVGPALTNPIALGDIDGDGLIDIVTIDSVANKLYVLRNTSNNLYAGSIDFYTPVGFYTGHRPINVSVSDLDGDGMPDIAVTCAGDSTISVFKNQSSAGNIQMAARLDFATPSQADNLVIGDVDGDGKNDLLFAVSGQSIMTLLNKIDPTPLITSFTPTFGVSGATINITGLNFTGAKSVAFGGIKATSFTINNDQSITAVLGSGASGNVSVTNGFGTFALPGFSYGLPPIIQSFSPASSPAGTPITITGQNFNPVASKNVVYFGGAKAVVTSASATQLVVNAPAEATYQPISVTANNFVGYSNIPFDRTFSGGDTTYDAFSFTSIYTVQGSIATVGDVNGDGKLDLVYVSAAGNLTVGQNAGLKDSVSFSTVLNLGSTPAIQRLYIADINADAKPDIIALRKSPSQIAIYLNTGSNGNLSFAAPFILTDELIDEGVNALYNLAIGDIDGDGLPDIAGADFDHQRVSVFHNQSRGSNIAFAPKTNYTVGSFASDIALSDIDGDGKMDMVVGGYSQNQVFVFMNNSKPDSIAFGAMASPPGNVYLGTVSVGDLDGDGKPDAIIGGITYNNVIAFNRNTSSPGNISWTQTTTGANVSSFSQTIEDLNGDGKPDLLLNDNKSNTLGIYVNGSSLANISFKTPYFMPNAPGYFTSVGDLNQDGKQDIIQSGGSTITIFSNKRQKIYTLPDTNFKVQFISSTCKSSNDGSITINAAANLPYTATIIGSDPNSYFLNTTKTFNKTLTLNNLQPGSYNICITAAGYPGYQSCITGNLTEPHDITLYAAVDNSGRTAKLHMTGGQSYDIQVNDIVYQTDQSDFTVPLQKGNNLLTVSTGKECQGVIKQRITIGNDIVIYPNPFEGQVQMDVGESQAASGRVEIVDMLGRQVFLDDAVNDYGKLHLDLSALKSGVYVVKLTLDNKQTVYKIWKK